MQSQIAKGLTVLRTELQDPLKDVATVKNDHGRLTVLGTTESMCSRHGNVTAKRETKSPLVFGERNRSQHSHGNEETNLIIDCVDFL